MHGGKLWWAMPHPLIFLPVVDHVENSTGSAIGEFSATDPDGDTNHTFTLIPPPKLWLDAADAVRSTCR